MGETTFLGKPRPFGVPEGSAPDGEEVGAVNVANCAVPGSQSSAESKEGMHPSIDY